MKPKFFARPLAFRAWLEKHHLDSKELLVGFHKKASGKPSITWPEAVDVVSAKKEETRLKRLNALIEASAKGRRLY